MGLLILPLAVVLFFFGISTQFGQLAQAVPGAGQAGQTDSIATVSAQQAEVFSTACVNAALAAPGLVSASIAVTLPAGVIMPANAVCMTMAAPSGGRNVYGYLPALSGEAGQVMSDTQMNATWFRVQSQGIATNIASGLTSAVPVSIPPGSLLEWVSVNP